MPKKKIAIAHTRIIIHSFTLLFYAYAIDSIMCIKKEMKHTAVSSPTFTILLFLNHLQYLLMSRLS